MKDLIERQAAIDTVKKMRECCDTEDINDYLDLLIEAFNVLPPAQPEPCEDAVSRADVVDMLEMYPFTEYGEYEAAREAVKRLPSVQPDVPDTNVGDMKSCIYCHEDSDGYVTPIEKNCHAFIRFGMNGFELGLEANGWHGSAKIRYCPMCGRELKT